MTKDSASVPTRSSRYPQCGNMFALIATKTGRHPQKFVPRFSGPFGHIDCDNDRKLATMYNIPTPRSKLLKPGTRTPFNSQELSAKMLSAFVDLFSPPQGIILDAYAGTMTTAIAALGTGRSCICIENNSNCFSASVQRLRQLLPGSSVARSIKKFNIDVQSLDESMEIESHGEVTLNSAESELPSECVPSEKEATTNFKLPDLAESEENSNADRNLVSSNDSVDNETIDIMANSSLNQLPQEVTNQPNSMCESPKAITIPSRVRVSALRPGQIDCDGKFGDQEVQKRKSVSWDPNIISTKRPRRSTSGKQTVADRLRGSR